MKIFDRFSVLRVLFPSRSAAADCAARWQAARVRSPELAADLVNLGRVLQLRPVVLDRGLEVPEPIDPVRLAYEQGQRDLAVKLLALMGVNNFELLNLMENDQ